MIGGDGKISGKPPLVAPPPNPEASAVPPGKATTGEPPAPPPSDRFVKEDVRPRADRGPTASPARASLGVETSGSADVLKLARENPAAARRLVGTLVTQASTALNDIERELVATRMVLEKLARERFAQKSCEAVAEELRLHRERIATLKLRLAMMMRKTALLQQVAGRLGDPRLDEEIDRILAHHHKLKTAWGRHHHLLSLGSRLFGADEETPEHLRQVVKTEVRTGEQGELAGDTLREVSPRAIIAELMARTLDGSQRTSERSDDAARRGEYGRTARSYRVLADLLEDALGRDPLAGKG